MCLISIYMFSQVTSNSHSDLFFLLFPISVNCAAKLLHVKTQDAPHLVELITNIYRFYS